MVEIHPHATKHLEAQQVLVAFDNIEMGIQRAGADEPPRWLFIGWLPDGRSVELIAVETMRGWLVIHARSPVSQSFAREIERTTRGIGP